MVSMSLNATRIRPGVFSQDRSHHLGRTPVHTQDMLRMPAEWEPHERTWMAWPSQGYAIGTTVAEAEATWAAWASVAHGVARYEPLTMVVDPGSMALAREWLVGGTRFPISLEQAPLNDAWMRDIGPTFVHDPNAGEPALLAVDWGFNGWGQQSWAQWNFDAQVAERVAAFAGVQRLQSHLVNEGGGIHVDGRGTLLVTETVQLDPLRNPELTRDDVEEHLRAILGVERIIWLPRGLTRDYERFGTRGHVDIVACFTPAGSVLVHDQGNSDHPDFVVTQIIQKCLQDNGFEIIKVPAPTVIQDDEGYVDYSYINHYVLNGAVLLCAFDDPHDEIAHHILQEAYPGRSIEMIDARSIFALGGGIHCITQQQPRLT